MNRLCRWFRLEVSNHDWLETSEMKAVGLEPTTYGLKELTEIEGSDCPAEVCVNHSRTLTAETSVPDPQLADLISLWPRLSTPDREHVVRMVQLMADAGEARRVT